jgi:hypothetical protein
MSRKAQQIILLVFLFSLAYSVARYHVFEGVPSKDFALFVMNKCLALAGFILLALNFSIGPARTLGVDVPTTWLDARKELGTVSFMIILIHMLGSVLIFGSGAYYGKFFEADKTLSAVGSWSMLLGILAFTWLWLYNISFKAAQTTDKALLELIGSRTSITVLGILVAGHVVVMGYQGWMTPENWAGGMPPITLVAFVVYLATLPLDFFTRK